MFDRYKKLSPFFSYFGGKWRAAYLYPLPRHRRIVEPFAGSAGYALRYAMLDVELYDVDPVICGVWDYLINVSAREILALPDLQAGQDVRDLCLPDEAKHLIGFWLNKGTTRPGQTMSAWARSGKYAGSVWGARVRQTIATQLHAIRHWTIRQQCYSSIENSSATWFVDPPYEDKGRAYRCNAIDYEALAAWCKTRNGLAIVCEQKGASWLPFDRLASCKTTRSNRSNEVIWIKDSRDQISTVSDFACS